ncbi:response regulator [Cyanobacteria bacterium FACHB-DQ100]|nr:response regulator [Cyanobacteria bacterium FACHB-DQ100]
MCHSALLPNGLRVLVVDANADSSELLTLLFASYGVETTTATCVREAIQQIHQTRPDLLISELALPQEDGYALIRQVQALETTFNVRIPAIAVTVYTRTTDRLQALSAGFSRHLSKPIDFDELIATVASVTEKVEAV